MKQLKKLQPLVVSFMSQRRSTVTAVMILIVLLATMLRLHDLAADSLWGDEIFEVRNAQRDLTSILSTNPLALRLTLAHTFMRIGGQDFFLRFPYAALGILGVILIYQVGRVLFDEGAGIIGAFLLAISPLHIQYSQETRSYSLTIVLILASLYCLLQALRGNQLRYWAGFALLTTLSLNNHITAASVVVSEVAFGALVLLVERLSGATVRGQPDGGEELTPSHARGKLGTWLLRLRSSREALLAISSLLGIVLFLVLSGAWFSYLSRIGVSATGSSADGSEAAIVQISPAFISKLLRDFGAGDGPVMVLFGAAFLIGLISSAIGRQWRQLALAPIWILPPFFILSRISATAYFSSKHLIFILPLYLLFVARGILGVSKLATQHVRVPANTRKLLQIGCVVLVTGSLAWFSVAGVRAYYSDYKEDWRGAATLIAEEAKPGDLVMQLVIWPSDPLPYYLDRLGAGETVKLVTAESASEGDFPATVWWVLLVAQPGGKPSPLPAPEKLAGSEFDTYSFDSLPYKSPAVLRRTMPVADRAEFLQLAAKLTLVQAQSDAWSYFEGHLKRLGRLSDLIGTSPAGSECSPEFLDPDRYVQAAREQAQNGQRQEAADSTLKAMAVYETLYPGTGRPHDRVLEALYSLGANALASGRQACSVLFCSRAADAYWLDVRSGPSNVEAWQNLAEALVKAERYGEAVAAYERLLDLAPDRWEYYTELARAYRAGGQTDRDIDMLEQAIKVLPDELRLLRALGDAYFLSGRMSEAASVFQQILEATPEDIEARFGLAWAYAELGQSPAAIREFQTLIEIDPEHYLVPEAESWLERLGQ